MPAARACLGRCGPLGQGAAERGATASQVAIAWVRAQHPRGVVIPILGARTRAQIDDNLAALDVELSADEIGRLNLASRIERGFPYDFGAARLAYGQTFDLIDDHRGLIKPLV
jgi:aryl-alcohol dehydrogenase-like predicted oxidoreductase